MGNAVCGVEKDIWIVIYEKGIADAARVQKRALQMTVEGKLSGYGMTASGSPPTSHMPLSAPRHTGKVAQADDSHSESGLTVVLNSGWMSAAASAASSALDSGGRPPPRRSSHIVKEPTAQDKFNAIRNFVEGEWTGKDRKELRKHSQKLWKQYHQPHFPPAPLPAGSPASARQPTRGPASPYLLLDELLHLTKDSLATLQSHMHLFIQFSYEEMKRNTMIGMSNLKTKGFTATTKSQQSSNQTSHAHFGAHGGQGSLAAAAAAASSGSAASSASPALPALSALPVSTPIPPGVGPTLALSDVTWLNEQVEARKKETMKGLNAQIEEWQEHALDIAEAIYARMDVAHNKKITQRVFVDQFGQAIYEVVGPNFFSQYLPAVGS